MYTAEMGADLLILAGGMATRLGAVNGPVPKALLPVLGTPFMDWQIREMTRAYTGLGRVFILARASEATQFYPRPLLTEESPLGTGGAILQANLLDGLSNPFLVLNGDVLFHFAPERLLQAAIRHGAALQCMQVPDVARFGSVILENGMITRFQEKTGISAPGLVNAGLYAFRKDVLDGFALKACSFETDIAPELARRGQLAAIELPTPFIDIGTPETYFTADAFMTENRFVQRA